MALALGAVCACKAYDPSLLPEQPARGATPIPAGGGASGSAADGGGGAAGKAEVGGGVQNRCGDGQVDATETCDTGIADGAPGACPIACGSQEQCQRVQLVGSGCQTECKVIERQCTSGDGCCPAHCQPAEDTDCSGQCGDGILQTDQGETCEPKPRNAASPRCPSEADCKDDDACTQDVLSGSADNCTAACKHVKIGAPQAGDGCCPEGANANTDADCTPKCGNGAREGDEACDGTTGCDASCKLTLTETQIECLDTLAESSCEKCECMSCSEAMFGCSKSGDASRDQACTMVERCAIEQQCAGSACYCGTARFGIDCVYRANGPCKEIIEAAAGTTSPMRIDAMYNDPNSVLGRAGALGACRRSQCVSECGQQP
ncbi:MAG TPA: hypothetical protein VJR89_20665 [Polyangiales bacterium]|nr:hypothetical protein [Polyangiales bacterium]